MIGRFIAFWDRRESPESLALLRVLVAGVLLLELAGTWALGLVPDAWAPPPDGLGWAAVSDSAPPSLRLLGAKASTVTLLFGVALAGAVLMLVGLFFRAGAVLLALASAELAKCAPEGDRAIDMLLRVAVLVLACSAADARFSVSAYWKRRRGRPLPELVPAWPRLLLFAQLVWMYFSAAHNRAGVAWWPWGGFAAISNILSDPHYARFAPGTIAPLYPLTQVMTAVTMLFELGSPLLLAFAWLERHPERGGRLGAFVRRRRLRHLWIGLGVLLHLGIAFGLRLGVFPYGMLALYPAFLAPAEVSACFRRVRCALGTR